VGTHKRRELYWKAYGLMAAKCGGAMLREPVAGEVERGEGERVVENAFFFFFYLPAAEGRRSPHPWISISLHWLLPADHLKPPRTAA
jgi:hypothetical protein